jgi:hypothetical protein
MSQLTAYLITIGVECPMVLLIVFWRRWLPLKRTGLLWVGLWGILASSITHPTAWHFNGVFQSTVYEIRVSILELLIFLAEGVIYHYAIRLNWSRAMVLSLIANIASYGIGMIVFYWFCASSC